MTKIACIATVGIVVALAACSSEDDSAAAPEAGAPNCDAAKQQVLGPIDKVSSGEVKTLATADGATTIYVDASAVSATEAKSNPRVYVSLATGKRVDVTDVTASSSKDWDLALKRPLLFTNGGDGGSGVGGAMLVDKDFSDVTAADALTIAKESFFDAACNAKLDPANAITTSFSGWYEYDQSTNALSPHEGTWIVKGGSGKLYKLVVVTYYAKPDGTPGTMSESARYTLKFAPLE